MNTETDITADDYDYCVDCGFAFFPEELDDGQCEDCWDVAVEADPSLYLERVQ